MNKYYEIFRRNFPFIVRNEEEAIEIIENPDNKYIDICNDEGALIATSIIHKNTILMLCVDEAYRNKGLGSKLLEESNNWLKAMAMKQ